MNIRELILDLANNWPGDEDNFVRGRKMNLRDESEVESELNRLGFNMYWTGNGYLVETKQSLCHES